MRRTLFLFVILLFPALVLALNAPKNQKDRSRAIPVIFDTDMGNDVDDVMALAMLLNYEKEGMISIKAITSSKANIYSVEYIDAFCRFMGRNDIPLGYVYDGPNPGKGAYLVQTLDSVVDGKKVMTPRKDIQKNLLPAYQMIRDVLAKEKDHSVVIISVGPETNLSRLLSSKADKQCKLSGRDLVRKKVKGLYVMGGRFNTEPLTPEWNILQDIQAAQQVFEQWPTPIVVAGGEVGEQLRYPAQSILHDFEDSRYNPLCISYGVFLPMPYDRQCWDQVPVIMAFDSSLQFFRQSERGNIAIDEKGRSIFTKDAKGLHSYVILNTDRKADVVKFIESKVKKKIDRKY